MEKTQAQMLAQMIKYAIIFHSDQVDRAGQPYILHPLYVMSALNSSDLELMQIAVGHDLLEDTKITEEWLRLAGFTDRVINGIVALTKKKSQSYEDYQQQVLANPDAVRVKLKDLEHNMDLKRLSRVGIVPTEKDLERQQRYLDFIRLLQPFPPILK